VILSRLGAGAAAHECAVYHDECFVKCPDQMRSLITSGGVRLGLSGPESAAAREVARYIDHTLLKPDATRDEILTICEEGARYGFASVCINPIWVREAACALRGSGVKVCTVIGFPLGANSPDTKSFEARRAIFDGASELDMVINIGGLKSGDHDLVLRDISGVVQVAHEVGFICKVIIETALLSDDEKVKACMISKEAGADFVKTSTGFSKGGATVADIALMRRVVGGEMGVKASGGVRDLKQAQEMIRAGATRIGASVGVKIVQEIAGVQQAVNGHTGQSY
jgi:deoxyribose-phosphate aldolase